MSNNTYKIETNRLTCCIQTKRDREFEIKLTKVPAFPKRVMFDSKGHKPIRVGNMSILFEGGEYQPYPRGSADLPYVDSHESGRLFLNTELQACIGGKLVVYKFALTNCSPIATVHKLKGLSSHLLKDAIHKLLEYVDDSVLPLNRLTMRTYNTVDVSTAHISMSDGLNLGKDTRFVISRSPDGVDNTVALYECGTSTDDYIEAGYTPEFVLALLRIEEACALAGVKADHVCFSGDGPVLKTVPVYNDWK